MAASQTGLLLAEGENAASALTGGFRLVFAISTALLVAGILLAATVLRTGTARQASEEFRDEATAEDAA